MLGALVGLDEYPALEVALGGLVGEIDAGAGGVVLPAVVDAANAVLLVTTEEYSAASVRASIADEGVGARRVAEGDQVFTQQPDPQRRIVRLELPRVHEWQPVLAHHVAHDGAGSDATEGFGLFLS